MSRQILTLLAAAPLVALTADDGRFEHKDWQLVCENNGTCRAAGYQKADDKRPISIRITRETGPASPSPTTSGKTSPPCPVAANSSSMARASAPSP